ncbi:hypothetical protein FF38_13993 [Lucilia cuprina]|uniref:Uncharacterized protein n=1 Tax=Lucilia cuprina TaxID=7375 RepID=A0A0L0C7R6_LUCCU|nr:hypothetical protein FF38_13993 [Lucilia cuprina]
MQMHVESVGRVLNSLALLSQKKITNNFFFVTTQVILLIINTFTGKISTRMTNVSAIIPILPTNTTNPIRTSGTNEYPDKSAMREKCVYAPNMANPTVIPPVDQSINILRPYVSTNKVAAYVPAICKVPIMIVLVLGSIAEPESAKIFDICCGVSGKKYEPTK